ncbi:restriction endonuclease subunit S [Fodinibius sediminis]|uniref:Type I restriction enzyme, S subunit n=1 Tax=Fodinibius sediminis TaxID=1214077 RepID=A0A521DL99_9BACT|nr:restriction endonuclease subunit S [Fodinibius sediminis]SMO72503.1 type I restriction enzyme, S subunit [Fodinibius sediminis]
MSEVETIEITEEKIKGWEKYTLGEVAEYLNGRAFKPEEWENKGLPIIRIQNLNDPEASYNYSTKDFKDRYLVQSGDLLFAWSASLDAYIWKGGNAWLNQHIFKVVPRDFIDNRFLFHYLKRIIRDLYAKSHGSGMVHVTKKKFENTEILVPPLKLQHRIVEKIEELFSDLDNGIQNLKKVKQQLETYKQSVLKAAFEGKFTKQWREQQEDLPTPEELKRHIEKEQEEYRQKQLKEWEQEVDEWEEQGEPGKKPRKPMKGRTFDPLDEELDSLPKLPNNWEWIRISDTVSRVEYGTSQKSEDSGDMPVLRMGNMQDGKFVWDDLVYSNDPEEIEKYLLQPGDVLFNRTNSPELVGKTALYKGKKKAIFAGYLIRLNQINTIIDARYLTYYLNSYEAQNYGNKVKTDGVNQSNINGTKLSGYPLPFTCLQEQKKVADMIDSRLSIVDQTEKTIEQELQKAKALRQSILKKAFEGKLIS